VKDNVRETILGLMRQKKNMQHVAEDDDFFELGVSSLTIIELQIGVEQALGVTIPTSQLMKLTTIRGWIDAYAASTSQHPIGARESREHLQFAGEAQQ
jgi:acyl carrier protein